MMKLHIAIWIILQLLILTLLGMTHPAEVHEEDSDYRMMNIYTKGSFDAVSETSAVIIESGDHSTSVEDDIGSDFDIGTTKIIFPQIMANTSSVSLSTEENEEIPLSRDPRFWTSLISLLVIIIGGIYVFFNFPFLQGDQSSSGESKNTTMAEEDVVKKGTVETGKNDTDSVDSQDTKGDLDLPDRRPFYGRLAKSFPHDRQRYAPQKKLKKPPNLPISGRTKEVKALPPHEPIIDEKTSSLKDIDPSNEVKALPPHNSITDEKTLSLKDIDPPKEAIVSTKPTIPNPEGEKPSSP